jgi:hypothetical protein
MHFDVPMRITQSIEWVVHVKLISKFGVRLPQQSYKTITFAPPEQLQTLLSLREGGNRPKAIPSACLPLWQAARICDRIISRKPW